MNAKVSDRAIELSLSRTNLETLLMELDDPMSRRTLYRIVRDEPRLLLIVTAEEDCDHYQSEDRQPDLRGKRGRMAQDEP